MSVVLHHGDCRDVVPSLVAGGAKTDAIVTDPPYNLTSIIKRFGSKNAVPAKSADHARLARGFMGLQWDGSEFAFEAETWRVLATILRPGGFLLAFGGTRTAHRMVSAIEDAGFVIQDTIAWMYGSGFPKRRDMLKPAFEPICVAYKPGGARTLQVDECRIETTESLDGGAYGGNHHRRDEYSATDAAPGAVPFSRMRRGVGEFEQPVGRWPANVMHDGSDEVMEAFPDAPGQQAAVLGNEPSNSARYIYDGLAGRHSPRIPVGDAGSAARFFYCAKADKQDRWGSRHPTVKPVELIRYLVKLVCPLGGTILDPFAGSGTAGVAAMAEGRNAILIEQDATYCADIRERLAHYEGDGRHSLASKARHRTPQEQVGTLL